MYGPNALVSGLKVITSLDADLETKAESIVNTYAIKNQKDFNASNASLIAVDPTTK